MAFIIEGMRVLVLGEILWDVFDKEERLGGAPFNFAAQFARLGNRSALVSAVGDDERGRKALSRARELGVDASFISTVSEAATGVVLVELDTGGQPQYEIRRPAAYDFAELDSDALARLSEEPPDWIYYGTLFASQDRPRRLLERVLRALPDVPRFYDVNLRPDSYDRELVLALLPEASVLKVNGDEVRHIRQMMGEPDQGEEAFARGVALRHTMRAVCITRAEQGSALLWDGEWVEASGVTVEVADAVGAGDAFSAALLHGVAQAWPLRKRIEFANRVGALIASKAGATPAWTPEEAWAL